MPLDLGLAFHPEPDVAVTPGPVRALPVAPPARAALVVEVADSSLARDCGEKAGLYARARLGEYWVIDLAHGRLLAYRDPRPDHLAPAGWSYHRQIFLGPAAAIVPVGGRGVAIDVADLLP